LANLANPSFFCGEYIGEYRYLFSPTRAFNSSLLTVLYRLNTLMVLWPVAALFSRSGR